MYMSGSPLNILGNFKWQHAFDLAWIQIEPGLILIIVVLLTVRVHASEHYDGMEHCTLT